MYNNEKIIVSMTSYPKRITNVSKSIFFLLTKQTVKPDEIHLWLAEPEFPNKEKDLPKELNEIISVCDNVFLHWLPKNTYCHKRHEIFKYTTDNDCVFLFDDDVRYNDRIIETVMKDHLRFPKAVIDYEWYSEHLYNGRKIIYKNFKDYSKPSVKIRWCGQSMIPSKVYPRECLDKEVVVIRDKICPICDESWFTPWLVKNDIEIYCEHFGWGEDLSKDIKKWQGLCSTTHQKEANGYEKRDNWLFEVLKEFPELMKSYKEKFGYLK